MKVFGNSGEHHPQNARARTKITGANARQLERIRKKLSRGPLVELRLSSRQPVTGRRRDADA
jgi:hypothetical protein